MKNNKLVTTSDNPDVEIKKKKYNSPKIMKYGTLAEQTQFLNFHPADLIAGSSNVL